MAISTSGVSEGMMFINGEHQEEEWDGDMLSGVVNDYIETNIPTFQRSLYYGGYSSSE